MGNESALHAAGVRGLVRGIKGEIIAASVLLAWDGAFSASFVFSVLVCPVWFLSSLLTTPIERPGWGLVFVRLGFPALTLGLVLANNAVQLEIAEANARRLIAACERYHAAHGKYPGQLKELVPQYLKSIPVSKYCLGPSSRFGYHNSGEPLLYWQVVPPYYRKTYNFETLRWSYLD